MAQDTSSSTPIIDATLSKTSKSSNQTSVAELVSQSSKYINVYDDLIAAGAPKFFDRVLSIIGMTAKANENRLARIKDYAQDIGEQKSQAQQTLVEAIHMAENWRDEAQRLNQSAMGSMMRHEPRLEVLRKQCSALEKSCRKSISFVQEHSQVDEPPRSYIQWTAEGRSAFAKKSMSERAKLEEEWRMYVDALGEVRQAERQLQEAERILESSALLESTYEESLRVLREERGRVNDRFDLLSVYINAQQLVEIEHFFDVEVRGQQLNYFANAIKGLEQQTQAATQARQEQHHAPEE